MEKLDKALDDANRSIALRPRAPRLYGLRATIYLCKNDPDTVVRETRSMESMFPGNSEVREWKERTAGLSLDRGHCLFRTDQERAVVWYGLAIEIEPEFAEAYHWRGVAQWNLKKVDLAYSDLKQAIRLAPRDLKSYQMMDSLLASQGRWDEIIEYWSRFLDAYLERAGAKRHKGEMQSALVDLKTACSLGNKEACSIMQQYR